jgi:hypothetical protein
MLVQKPTYADINDVVRGQHVDLAVVPAELYHSMQQMAIRFSLPN